MTPADFEKRWAHDLAHAEKTILKDGHLSPLFIVIGADGRSSLIPATFADDAEKAHFMNLARLHAVAVDAEAVLLRTESWLVVGDDRPAGVSPGQSDRRVEVVSVAASARYGKRIVHRLSAREIVRGPDGRPTALREVAVPGRRAGAGMEGAGGPMFDLLPPIRPTPEQRKIAAAMVQVMRERTA